MSSVPRQSLTLAVLEVYFDEVVPLERYLDEILKPSAPDSDFPNSRAPLILADDEPQSYCDLVKTSYVGLKSDALQRPSFQVMAPLMYMRDVSLRAHDMPYHEQRGHPVRSYRRLTSDCFLPREQGPTTSLLSDISG